MAKQNGEEGVKLVDRARVKSALNGIVIENRPTHHIGGQNNMHAAAMSIDYYYNNPKKSMPAWIRVRFGHCTHASYATAKILGKYGINCDVCLSSNLATSAYTWPKDMEGECKLYEQGRATVGTSKAIFGSRGWRTPYEQGEVPGPVNDVLSYESALESGSNSPSESGPFGEVGSCGSEGAALDLCYTWSSVAQGVKSVSNVLNWMSEDCIVRGFDQHAFLSLFINKVQITFGMDASQVEHSDYLQDTYFANLFIKRFRTCCGIEEKPNPDIGWKKDKPECGNLPQMEYICEKWKSDLLDPKLKSTVLAIEEVTFNTLLVHNMDAARFVLGPVTASDNYKNNFEKTLTPHF